jgi:DNA topoisomerase-1
MRDKGRGRRWFTIVKTFQGSKRLDDKVRRSGRLASPVPQAKKLIIVESPAKAKTIGRFLGSDYIVEASFGHVRDLPQNAAEIPDALKKEKWAKLGVNVEKGFEPLYVIPSDKKKRLAALKAAMKDAGSILLATDEDREGESISWHILQVLSPKKGIEVKRIVFHEVTREAIEAALRAPRDLDDKLVKAQEARRVLDRLFGYTLSPLLWKKVVPGLSAGRVQSVAVRLTVERERERMRFKSAEYWDIEADLRAGDADFTARLSRVDGAQVADGKSFDPVTGSVKSAKHRLLTEVEAKALADVARGARPWKVTSLTESPGTQKPAPPFTTSTLQQESNRKLKFTAKKTMQIAQQLYEGIDLGGDRVGLITYMRTDSLTLAERALQQAQEVIKELYGPEYTKGPVRYKTSSKGAQEAHEAIRPTDLARKPQDVRKYLDNDQFRLYEMIWKRTLASQMLPARFTRSVAEVSVENMVFSASGRQIVFPGFLRAYVEGSDDPEAELGDKEVILPRLKQGQEVEPTKVEAQGHSTKPPQRYTEASLVKKLEEEGIGRPSTYATVISTIQDRGYVFKRNNELVPTFTAFCVTELLELHFDDLVDLKFTARMEDQLDRIAEGVLKWDAPLREFYFGKANDGLVERVKAEEKRLGFPSISLGNTESGEAIVVKIGKFGPYVQRGEGGPGNVAGVPEGTAPSEVTADSAVLLIENRGTPESVVEVDGRKVALQKGRFGDYLQVEENGETRNVTLPSELKPSDITPEIAQMLTSLPRTLGTHPKTGEEVSSGIGRYGPFVKAGKEYRNLASWRQACDIGLDEAVALLDTPKAARGRSASVTPIKELGALKVMNGRFGPYVTDGEVNATIPKGMSAEAMTEAEARDLIETKRAAGPSKRPGRRFGRKRS